MLIAKTNRSPSTSSSLKTVTTSPQVADLRRSTPNETLDARTEAVRQAISVRPGMFHGPGQTPDSYEAARSGRSAGVSTDAPVRNLRPADRSSRSEDPLAGTRLAGVAGLQAEWVPPSRALTQESAVIANNPRGRDTSTLTPTRPGSDRSAVESAVASSPYATCDSEADLLPRRPGENNPLVSNEASSTESDSEEGDGTGLDEGLSTAKGIGVTMAGTVATDLISATGKTVGQIGSAISSGLGAGISFALGVLTSNADSKESKIDEVNGIRAILNGSTLGGLEDSARENQNKRRKTAGHVAPDYAEWGTNPTETKQRENANKGGGAISNTPKLSGIDTQDARATLERKVRNLRGSVVRPSGEGEEPTTTTTLPRKQNKAADPVGPSVKGFGRSMFGRGPKPGSENPVPVGPGVIMSPGMLTAFSAGPIRG